MKSLRRTALVLLAAIYLAGLSAAWLAPAGYANQFRESAGAPPSRAFLLGTDDLGRDSFSRLLYGSRLSLTLAPAAALLATLIAALVGITAGYAGGWIEICLMRVTDLFLSIPWLFLLLIVRAFLPLNVRPLESVAITFCLLGLLGWAGQGAAQRDPRTQNRGLHGAGAGARVPAAAADVEASVAESRADRGGAILDLGSNLHPE